MAEFTVSLTELRRRAEELQQLNQQFNGEIEKLQETEGALNGMWEGQAKQSFHTAFTRDIGQMHTFYSTVNQYAAVLMNVIEQYRAAETTNVNIASTRTY